MIVAKFNHANLKTAEGKPREVYVAVPQAFSWYFSEAHKCTHIVATGGAIMPVIESPEDVSRLFQMEGKP